MTPSDMVTGTSRSTTKPFVSGRSYFVHLGAASALEGTTSERRSSVRRASFRTVLSGNARPGLNLRQSADEGSREDERAGLGRVPADRVPRAAPHGLPLLVAERLEE